MKKIAAIALLAALFLAVRSWGQRYLSGVVWPEPPIVAPGTTDSSPPADAIVLFDGKSLDAWKGGEKQQIDSDGGFTSKAAMATLKDFGDIQLHLEFASPKEVRGAGQERGNSGIGLMGRYEIQILDNFDNKTYPEGQCASVYNQRPPTVNVCRKPGEWQSLDIVFTAPRFGDDGSLQKPAYVTVLHNGVFVQNHVAFEGHTRYDQKPRYDRHPGKLPLTLKYHGTPVRFRNIWLRELKDLEPVKKG